MGEIHQDSVEDQSRWSAFERPSIYSQIGTNRYRSMCPKAALNSVYIRSCPSQPKPWFSCLENHDLKTYP